MSKPPRAKPPDYDRTLSRTPTLADGGKLRTLRDAADVLTGEQFATVGTDEYPGGKLVRAPRKTAERAVVTDGAREAQKLLRQQDRAWREQQKRTRS